MSLLRDPRNRRRKPIDRPNPRCGAARALFLWVALGGAAGCSGPTGPAALLPLTAERDPRLPQLRVLVAGHTRVLHLETFGDSSRPVLLAFHGGEGSDYRSMLPLQALADRYFVVLWDNRGSGLSERIGPDEITEQAYADEVQAVKDHFSPDAPVALVAYSYGGFHAALYLTHHAGQVSQLVLIEPLAPNSEANLPDPAVPFSAEWVNDYLWQDELVTPDDDDRVDYKLTSVAQAAIEGFSCDPAHPSHYPLWRMGARVWTRTHEVFARYDYRSALAALDFPVLIVATHCGDGGVDYQRRHVAPVFREARLVSLPEGVDHLNLFQRGQTELLAALRDYLAPGAGSQP